MVRINFFFGIIILQFNTTILSYINRGLNQWFKKARINKGHAFPSFFEPLIQTMVFIAQNDRIELKNNKTKKNLIRTIFGKIFYQKLLRLSKMSF